MLVLTRKSGESIRINNDIIITIIESSSGYVRIGVTAPRDIPIYRNEIYERIQLENREAAKSMSLDTQLILGLKKSDKYVKQGKV